MNLLVIVGLNLIFLSIKSLERLAFYLNLWLDLFLVVLRNVLELILSCLGLAFLLHAEFHLLVLVHWWLLNILGNVRLWLRLVGLSSHVLGDLRLNVLKPLHLPLLFIAHLALFSDHFLHLILLLLHLFHVLSVVIFFNDNSLFRRKDASNLAGVFVISNSFLNHLNIATLKEGFWGFGEDFYLLLLGF